MRTEGLVLPEVRCQTSMPKIPKFFWCECFLDPLSQYNAGVTGLVGDITTGALYFVAHGNNSATAQWSVDYSIRYKYHD